MLPANLDAVALEKAQTLFECKTDRVIDLTSSNKSGISQSRLTPGNIKLTLEDDGRTLTLSIRSAGQPLRREILRNVEQGNSPGSGAGGHADTIIQAYSAGRTFTLFASYENNDQDAALKISGPKVFLLVCAGGRYEALQVKGVGQYGLTSIFTLSVGGLAAKLKTIPPEPNF